jgi:hypothetical protein
MSPLKCNQLRNPKSVAIANEDKRLIANSVPVAAGRGDHVVNFTLVQPVTRRLASDFALYGWLEG